MTEVVDLSEDHLESEQQYARRVDWGYRERLAIRAAPALTGLATSL
jgi:hypothetical protein